MYMDKDSEQAPKRLTTTTTSARLPPREHKNLWLSVSGLLLQHSVAAG
jgi:hypothetical protein